jgi:hypothetical protein
MIGNKMLAIIIGCILVGCSASVRHPNPPHPDPDGFRDIKWGTRITALENMEEVNRDSGRHLVWYRKKGVILALGGAKLDDILYSFWMGEFDSVWIDFHGEENLEALRKALFEGFAEVRESQEHMRSMGGARGGGMERPQREPSLAEGVGGLYTWWGKNTEVVLSYSKDLHKGHLTMNSTRLGKEREEYENEKEKQERLKRF